MTPEHQDFWFLPLGGTGEIGMNMNLYGHDGQWLMVDCGVIFENYSRLDGETDSCQRPHIQMADPKFIADQCKSLAGLVITHAHEDHIGAVPYIWEKLKCPIFTTAFTAEILRRKLTEVGLDGKVPVTIVEPNEILKIGVFSVEWVALTHSIPEPYGMVISTPVGRVFHTADWKLDKKPVIGSPYNKEQYQELSKQKIDAMVCDSTNANSTSLTVFTLIGRSKTQLSVISVCEIAVKRTMRSAPAAVITCGGVNDIPMTRCVSFVIRPVEPELAPGTLDNVSNPASQPAGASRNKS